MWKCAKCGYSNWDDATSCDRCQAAAPPPPPVSKISDDEEHLFGNGRGSAFIYKRGEHSYELPHFLDTPSDVCKTKLSWIRYWTGPREDRQLSAAERQEVLERAAILLQKQGFKVIVTDDENAA